MTLAMTAPPGPAPYDEQRSQAMYFWKELFSNAMYRGTDVETAVRIANFAVNEFNKTFKETE